MKKNLVFALLCNVLISLAQSAEEKCEETLQYFYQYAKTKDYEAAYPYLQQLRKECPSYNKAIYSYGEFVLRNKIDNATPEQKEAEVRDLLKLYDEHDKYFADNNAGNTMKKGLLLLERNVGTKDEMYQFFDQAYKNDNKNFNSAKALYAYFELFVNDYELGTKGITLQQVFDKYDDISDKLDIEEKELSDQLDVLLNKIEAGETLSDKETKAKNRYEVNLEAFSTVKGGMDAKIVLLSTCEKLIPFYQKSFEENKSNEQWLRRAAERLAAKDCDSDPLFTKISEALHKLKPTAESAFLLGRAAQKAKNTAKALEYFNQAADLFTDATKKAKVLYHIATMYGTGNKVQARNYARKALAVKPSFGYSYLLIAQLYQSSANECGSTPFDKRAVYWLCAQYANKAAAVDPSLKAAAQRQAASYIASAPSKSDIFNEGKQGQRISFNCWIGESVVVPNL